MSNELRLSRGHSAGKSGPLRGHDDFPAFASDFEPAVAATGRPVALSALRM